MENPFHQFDTSSVYNETRSNIYETEPKVRENPMFSPSAPSFVSNVNQQPTEPAVRPMMIGGIISPETYDGTTDPRIWLDNYTFIADANLWSDNIKFLKLISCLKGAPYIWFSNERKRNPHFNWENFKEGLVSRFTNTCDNLMIQTKIHRRKQLRNETFQHYWESKLQLIEAIAPFMSFEDKKTNLIMGLEDSLLNKVLERYMTTSCDTLEQLFNLIKRAYDAINFTAPRNQYQPQRRHRTEYNNLAEQTNRNPNMNRNSYQQQNRNFTPMSKIEEKLDKLTDTLTKTLTLQSPKQPQQKNYNYRQQPKQNYPNRQHFNQRSEPKPSTSTALKQPYNKNYDQRNKNTDQNKPRMKLEDIECYTCHEKGHFASRCPNRNKSPQQNTKQGNETRRN
jgi:hypothetical protein